MASRPMATCCQKLPPVLNSWRSIGVAPAAPESPTKPLPEAPTFVTNKLLKSGFLLKELMIYETKPNSLFTSELDKLLNSHEKKKIDWIVFFSPSGVDISLEVLKNRLLEDWNKIKIASIGKTTTSHLEKIKKIDVNVTSPKPEAESLAKSIHEYFNVQ